MLKLYGFPLSNYYNAAKMALLEKGADFEEVAARPSQEGDFLSHSPMGKVPCLETPEGFLSETSVIIEYVDETMDGPALLPSDPWARAQTRELMREVELYVDLAVRPCFAEAFFGGEVSDEVKAKARKSIEKGIAAVGRRAKFAPYLAGSEFTAADALAFYCLPLASAVGRRLWDADPLAPLEGAKAWKAKIAERPSAQKIAESQKQ